MKCPDLKQLVLLIFEMMKKVVTDREKHACCVTWNKIWKLWKTNHDNVKFCNKNVNVVEKNYIKAQKYLTMKRKLARSRFVGAL